MEKNKHFYSQQWVCDNMDDHWAIKWFVCVLSHLKKIEKINTLIAGMWSTKALLALGIPMVLIPGLLVAHQRGWNPDIRTVFQQQV